MALWVPLVKELVDHNLHVIGVGGPIKSNDRPPCTDDYIVLDLMDKRAIQANIDFREIDGVITWPPGCRWPVFDNPLDYMTTNIGLEVNLLRRPLLQKLPPGSWSSVAAAYMIRQLSCR